MSETFSGRVVRTATWTPARNGWPPQSHESFYLTIDESLERQRLFIEAAHRTVPRWWFVDYFEFTDAPKRQPALLYLRRVDTVVSTEQFVAAYAGQHSLTPDGEPQDRNPHGPDPSPRGAPEDRQRELSMHQRVFGMDPDDPWADVRTAYEHWWTRVIVRVASGFVEMIWFSSTGPDEDPLEQLAIAWSEFAAAEGGELVYRSGPYPANEIARPSRGLRVGKAHRSCASPEEYEAKFVTLDFWRTPPVMGP